MTRTQLEHVLRAASAIASEPDVATAVLPEGWRERLVVVDTAGTAPGRGLCLDRHDCVVAKLVAGRAKDFAFAGALVRADGEFATRYPSVSVDTLV